MAYDYEYKTPVQVDYGWGLTLNMTGKAPAISKRIFLTKELAQKYIDNKDDSAIAGIAIGVISDPMEDNNGLYFVNKVADDSGPGVMTKVGSGNSVPFVVVDNTLLTDSYLEIEDELLILSNE